MQVHVLRLNPGDDLRASLESSFAVLSKQHGIEAACIMSAVGSLSRAVLRYADKPVGSDINASLELLMLSGTLSANGAHVHASVADEHGEVKGGHPEAGWTARDTG